MINGNFEKVKINEASCLKLDTEQLSKMDLVVPELFIKNLGSYEYLYNTVNDLSPQMASYLIRPSEILDTLTSKGIEGLQKMLLDQRADIIATTGINPALLGDFNSYSPEHKHERPNRGDAEKA